MEYFCYISRSKIDQFFQNLNPEGVDEWTENQSSENDVSANAEAGLSITGILNLFKGGITYGRKGTIQRERKIKIQYVEKLKRVLLAIAKEKPIPPLREALVTSTFDSLFYSHDGEFKIQDPVLDSAKSDTIITITTNITPHKLLLDCSLRFFSEGNEPDGSFATTSTNWRFFSAEIPLMLQSVFMLIGRKDNKIIGTPLFLKMDAPEIPIITYDQFL